MRVYYDGLVIWKGWMRVGCVGNKHRGRPRTKWIKSVELCLEKRNIGLDEARGLVHNRNEWRGIVRVYGCGPRSGDEPLH